MKDNTKQGVGLTTRQADVVTYAVEELLWHKEILGEKSPKALLRALFFEIGINFGLRS